MFNATLNATSSYGAKVDVAMANVTRQLTNTEVKQSKAKEKEYSLADGNCLYLRVKPNGTKIWVLNYSRPITKKRANLSLGTYPSVSLAEARAETIELRALLAKDIDPKDFRLEEDRKSKAAWLNTFEHVAQFWLKLKESKISASYYKKISSRLDLHVFPNLGKIPLHKINAVDTIEVLTPLAKQGKFETINNLCGWINEIMVYSVNTGLIPSNPLAGIGKAFDTPLTTNLPTLKPEELPELMAVLNRASIKIVTRCLIEWQLNTMVRPAEASGARWSEINIEKAQWIIPAERMKKRKPHIVPLSQQSLAILEILRPINGHREFVFSSDRSPRKPANSQTANMALKRMGFKGRLVAHGLRALASTTLNEHGFDPDVIEAALAHTDKNSIRAAYNRAEYLDRRRTMMAWWSDYIEQAASGNLSLASGLKHLKVVAVA